MELKITRSIDLTKKQWHSYTRSFNTVFSKNFAIEYFIHKYLKNIDGTSYHTLLFENNEVVGGCTVIPNNYLFGSEKIKTGLVVDVFILPAHRSDPYALLRMYKALKERLREENIAMIIAVPNEMVYPYWKNIVKWKDIGTIPYYAYPVRLANVLRTSNKLLNSSSLSLAKINIGINSVMSMFWNPTQKRFPISLDRSDPVVEAQRYTSDHVVIKNDLHSFAYRIVDENKVQTAYLIDFYNQENLSKDLRTLLLAVKYILKNHQIDLLIFVGKLHFFQTILIKIPFNKEPKHLYLTGDLINTAKISSQTETYNCKNWDFGLFNYDVR